jgi:hypothetical protein
VNRNAEAILREFERLDQLRGRLDDGVLGARGGGRGGGVGGGSGMSVVGAGGGGSAASVVSASADIRSIH